LQPCAERPVEMEADYCLYTIGLGAKDIPTVAIDD
jgi:hypothetical protein